jgi:hypothetical protein
MATKKVDVEVDVKSNVKESVQGLRDLRKELRNAAAGSEEFKKISADIRGVEDAIEGAKLQANDFAGALEAAPGPVGNLARGFKQVELATKNWGTALKATGIGLIVSLVAGLVGAFREQEDIMKKIEPLLIGLEKIFNGIFAVVEPLLDIFLDLALQALPFMTKGIGAVYSVLAGFFQLVKDVGLGVGQMLKGIFTLDFDSVKEGWNTLKDAIPNTIQAVTDSFGRYEQGTNRLTNTERKNAAERQKTREEETKRLEEELRKRLEAQARADAIFLLNFEDEQRELAEALLRKIEREKILREAGYTDLTVAEELYRKEVEAISKKYDDIDEAQRKKAADNALAIERAKAEGILQINRNSLDAAANFGALLLGVAGQNKALAAAGVIIEQAASIARIIQATNVANALTIAKFAAIPGGAVLAARAITVNKISAGIGIAASVAAGARALSKIKSVNLNSTSQISSSSAGSSRFSPAPPPERDTPQFSVAGGTNPTQQIAQTLAGITNRPLRAYVVSGEVSSQQALDRRTSRAATFT